jgi:hypothetical protein
MRCAPRLRASPAAAACLALTACGAGAAATSEQQLLARGLDYVRQPAMIPDGATIEHAFLTRWSEGGRSYDAVCGTFVAAGRRVSFVRPSVADDHPTGIQTMDEASRSLGIPEWNLWCGRPVSDAAGRPVEYRGAAR